jgi:WD40 repeat protein
LDDFVLRIAGFHTLTNETMQLVQGQGYLLSAAEESPIFVISEDGYRPVTEPPVRIDVPMRAVAGDAVPEGLVLERRVADVVYSPDGILAAVITGFEGGNTDGVYLWDQTEGEITQVLRELGPEDYQIQVEEVIYDAAFSPDGRLLAVGTGASCCLLGSPYISLGNAIVVYDVATGDELVRLHGHTDRVMDVEFSTDGSALYSASWDGTVKVWGVPE